jgi:ABC-type uncharacterized transport system ATPase subunit
VFLSSHILSDVERTCDHVVMLSRGRVVFADSMTNVRADADDWEIEVLSWRPEARAMVDDVTNALHATASAVRCKTENKDTLLLRLLTAGASIGTVQRTQSLEDLYMRHAKGTSDG